MKFWMKSQKVDQDIRVEHMVNVCDETLLGNEIGSVKVSEYFYKGELVDAEKMLSEIQEGTLVNLFGNDCVKLALEAGIVNKEGIKEIQGVKHAIVLRMD